MKKWDLPARAVWLSGLIAVACTLSAAAQDDADVSSLSQRTEGFFDNLQRVTVEPKTAFGELLINGPLRDPARDGEVTKMVERYNGLAEKYGAFVEYEQISAKRIGNDLIFLKYLYKTEKYPIVWYFTFYRPRPEDGWFVIAVRFDTRLDLLELTD